MHISFPKSISQIAIFNASHVTTELPGSLLSAIRSVHELPERISIVKEIDYNNETILYIIICPAGWRDLSRTPIYFITYQLDVWYVLDRPADKQFLSKALYNWDYSMLNVNHSAKQNYPYNHLYVPPGYTEILSLPEVLHGTYLYSDDNKDMDILFLGWDQYPHRLAIKNDFKLTPLKIWFASGLDLYQMQLAIKRSKICLNLHVSDDWAEKFSLQTIRLNLLLSNQACVVSEDIDDPEKQIYQNYVKFVPQKSLVLTCLSLLENFKMRRDMAIKSHQWYREERKWTKLVDFNRLLPLNE